ncbi:MAG: hypothetical protein LBP54_06400 [Campylobacteraceae bacterium]|jgi:predicted small secreted protein|nr:hypothetical protein [Campylobacteraceae bacterium]
MKRIACLLMTALFLAGCSNTWHGMKNDAQAAADWTKEKVNQGASYVKEKTE